MSENLTTTSVVSLFDTNKEERRYFISDFLSRYYEGEINPLKAHYAVKCMEEVIKSVTSDHNYKEMLLEEASKYGGKRFDFHNSEVQIKETGVKYDYTSCGDQQLNEMYAQLDELEKKVKEREDFLKKLPVGGIEMLVGDEVVKLHPPNKTSTTTVQMTLK